MTIEEKLKEYILSKYKSIREFVNSSGIDMPYTTIDGMLKRGINNASVTNVIKLCNVLHISTDELAKGKIVPTGSVIQKRTHIKEIEKIVKFSKMNLQEYNDLTIDGETVTENEMMMLLDVFEMGIDLIKKKRDRELMQQERASKYAEKIKSGMH